MVGGYVEYVPPSIILRKSLYADQKFGSKYVCKVVIVIRDVYRLKIDGADFRNHIHDYMIHINYISCLADTDI